MVYGFILTKGKNSTSEGDEEDREVAVSRPPKTVFEPLVELCAGRDVTFNIHCARHHIYVPDIMFQSSFSLFFISFSSKHFFNLFRTQLKRFDIDSILTQ
jgi:hypothetical protein